jgi:Xaa-Pro dipeptidase
MASETNRNPQRIDTISTALWDAQADALVCTLPEDVLLLSGYWPVVGTSVAVTTAAGTVHIIAPEDEADLARSGWANEVRTYAPGSLSSLAGPSETIREPLTKVLADLGVAGGRIACDDGEIYSESPYAAVHLFGSTIVALLAELLPGAATVSAHEVLARLRAALTPYEVSRVRQACEIAGAAFSEGVSAIRPGARECDVAEAFRVPMVTRGIAAEGVQLAGAFTWCMSGENSALAGGAYARSRNRELRDGDLVLIHCNSYLDGYWTDITRTYCLGEPDERQRAMYDAVSEAREAALSTVRPGVRAADVDGAARRVLTDRGYGEYFTHGIGHNVGFSAISAEFPPRLHPASSDVLESGMTFNIEPAIYIQGYGGMRHCDVVTVGEDGPEVLTPFAAGLKDLVIS